MIYGIAAAFFSIFIFTLVLFASNNLSALEFSFYAFFSLLSSLIYVASGSIITSVVLALIIALTGNIFIKYALKASGVKELAVKGIIVCGVDEDSCIVWIDGKIYAADVPDDGVYMAGSVVKAVITDKSKCNIICKA